MRLQLHNIESTQYDKTSKTLEVVYHDRICFYYHVPLFFYHEMIMSENTYSYVRKHIHPYFHREEKINHSV